MPKTVTFLRLRAGLKIHPLDDPLDDTKIQSWEQKKRQNGEKKANFAPSYSLFTGALKKMYKHTALKNYIF